MRRDLIVTADDFGLALPVNEAVERGHRQGILSTASLMVGAPASADAVARARAMPSLRVGLHIVLVNGKPVLDPQQVPDLVDADGALPRNLLQAGMRFYFNARARRQLAAEIEAQFAAFAETGLDLDHVNAQNHMHVHPTVLSAIMRIGPRYGMRAVRIPYEPFWQSWRAMRTDLALRAMTAVVLAPWLALMRRRLRRAGIATNDYVFGMHESGRMNPTRVRRFIEALPKGVGELYLHPAIERWPQASPNWYDFEGEFAALVDPHVVAALACDGIRRTTFSDIAAIR